jgi:hypothetical protein
LCNTTSWLNPVTYPALPVFFGKCQLPQDLGELLIRRRGTAEIENPMIQTEHRANRRFRFLGEIGAIALGVFLGLAADAAWDTHQSKDREGEYLQALQVEMLEVKAEFDTDQGIRLSRLAGIDSVLAQFADRTATDESIASWILQSRRIAVFYPPSAVFEDLISSGSLQLLRSDELRFALMEYQQNKPRLRFLEDRERIFVEQELRPYLVGSISFSGPQPSGAIQRILGDQTFRNLMEIRRYRIQNTLDYAVFVGDAIDRILSSLEG